MNKALYSVNGLKVRIKDSSVASSISSEGEVEVETVTVDSLGRFDLVKMNIEGIEGEVIREDSKWLIYVRTKAVEVHDDENLINIPKILTQRDFTVREMRRSDLIENALRNVLTHPTEFFRVEARIETPVKTLKGVYKVPV